MTRRGPGAALRVGPARESLATPPLDRVELLHRQLRWLIGVRIVVVSTVVLLIFLLQLLPATVDAGEAPEGRELVLLDTGHRFVFALVGFAYAASLLYIAFLRILDRRDALHAYTQFAGDVILTTGLVYHFGGIASPFSMLYLIVISVGATLLRRRAGIIVATWSYTCYTALLLALYFHWIPLPSSPFVEEASAWRLSYNLVSSFFGFYGVALLTSHLAQNVTRAELKLVEQTASLADLQIEHHDIIQSISSGLLTTDLAGRLASLNRTGEQVLGASEATLLGRTLSEIGLFPDGAWEHYTARTRDHQLLRGEVRYRRGERTLPVGFTLTTLADGHGSERGFILVFQDLSELRKLEEELQLKDRMAAVGELAAGIAHEIGNPLAAISGSVQILARDVETDPDRKKLLGILSRESQRLDRTVKSFLKFARPKERASVHFDVVALLREHAALLSNSGELGPDHRIETEFAQPSVRILADPDQVSQIFWNLARNALRAMPDGGLLRLFGGLGDSGFRFAVRDTGRGMTTEERSRLFQPFQSRFRGGSGIGMSIVYRIVEEHGGRLAIDTAPGKGTTITVELPVGPAGSRRDSGGSA